jgi:outer membrane protein assembly factor BamE (lipoprotein component of BamABCDE complex)
MTRSACWVAAGALTVSVAACSTQTSNGGASAPAAVAAPSAPAGSPLAKVQTGMSKKQVRDILGSPTDETGYQTNGISRLTRRQYAS